MFGVETQNVRIHSEVLDPDLGCLVLGNQTFTTYFGGIWTQTWDAWCWKPIFKENIKNTYFYMAWEPAWYTKADPADPPLPADPADPAEVVHSWQFAP